MATDQLLAKLVEVLLGFVTAERIRPALTEVGQASGPLADVLQQAEAVLSGAALAEDSSYQRAVRTGSGSPARRLPAPSGHGARPL